MVIETHLYIFWIRLAEMGGPALNAGVTMPWAGVQTEQERESGLRTSVHLSAS